MCSNNNNNNNMVHYIVIAHKADLPSSLSGTMKTSFCLLKYYMTVILLITFDGRIITLLRQILCVR